MDDLLQWNAVLLGLLGLAGTAVSIYIWRYLIPVTSVEKLRGELSYYLSELARKDEELVKFRQSRELDVRRLVDAEADLRRMETTLRDMRSWRYGAEQYIRMLEVQCRQAGHALPDRKHYGIDAEIDHG